MLGVGRITAIYANMILECINDHVAEIIDAGVNDTYDLVIGSKIIKQYVNKYVDDFLDFPVQKINLKLNFVSRKIKSLSGLSFCTGGACYPFSTTRSSESSLITKRFNKSLGKKLISDLSNISELNMGLDLHIDLDKWVVGDMDKMWVDMMSSIMHELNHAYEFYCRYNNKSQKHIDMALCWVSVSSNDITKKVKNKFNDFIYLLYYSLSYEMNAKVQELYPYVLRYDYSDFKENLSYKKVISVSNFDAKLFYDELVSLIPINHRKRVLNKILNSFKDAYELSCINLNETPDNSFIRHNDVLSLLMYHEKRLKKSGKIMKRKILKLYSLKERVII
jgi:hypothetical protein